MSTLVILFVFCVLAALVVFWYTYQVTREQRMIEQRIETLESDRASGRPRTTDRRPQ